MSQFPLPLFPTHLDFLPSFPSVGVHCPKRLYGEPRNYGSWNGLCLHIACMAKPLPLTNPLYEPTANPSNQAEADRYLDIKRCRGQRPVSVELSHRYGFAFAEHLGSVRYVAPIVGAVQLLTLQLWDCCRLCLLRLLFQMSRPSAQHTNFESAATISSCAQPLQIPASLTPSNGVRPSSISRNRTPYTQTKAMLAHVDNLTNLVH